MRVHFDEALNDTNDTVADSVVIRIYMDMWYSSLFVVIEGWRELYIDDNIINELLKSENVDLLRKYRNSVFHYS